MDEQVERQKTTIGIDTVQLGSIGVYHYRLNGLNTGLSTCSVIANSGPRVSILELTRNPLQACSNSIYNFLGKRLNSFALYSVRVDATLFSSSPHRKYGFWQLRLLSLNIKRIA